MRLRRYALPAGWILYTLMMVGIFLALTFPYDPLHARLLIHLSERAGMDIRAERWNLQLPAGIVWSHPSFVVPGWRQIDAEQIQAEVKLGSLLRGQPVLGWTGRLGERDGRNGFIKGELSLASWSWSGPAQVLGSVDQLDLSRLGLPLVKKGILRTRFERRWTDLSRAYQSWLEEGTWHVELTAFALEQGSIGPRSIPSVILSSLSGRLECGSGACRIEALRGEGPDGMLSGEGVLVLHEPVSTSHLTLTLSLIMTEALRERFHLTGIPSGGPGLPQKVTLSGPLSDLQLKAKTDQEIVQAR